MSRERENVYYMVCPSCGRITATDTGYCRHCGAPLSLAIALGPRAEPPPDYQWDIALGVSGNGAPAGIRLQDLSRHLVVYGVVGAGKTTLVKRILYEARLRGVDYIVLDWEGEYRDTGAEILTASPRGGLRLGLFSPDPAPPQAYASWLVGVIAYSLREEGWELTPMMELVLSRAVKKTVEERDPSKLLDNVWREAEKTPQGRSTGAALEARLSRLVEGPLASIIGNPCTLCSRRGPLVVDLSPLARINVVDARLAARAAIAKIYYSYPPAQGLRLLLVVEEAEEVIPASGPRNTLVGMLASYMMHMRKRGIGVIIVAHSPSLVDSSARKIPANTVALRVEDPEDAAHIAARLGLERQQARIIQGLARGEAVVKPAGAKTPYMVRIRPPPTATGRSLEEKVLQSIYTHPHLSMSERKAYLGLDGTTFLRIVESLVEQGKVRVVTAYRGPGRPVKLLQARGMNPSAPHYYGEARVEEAARELGLRVSRSREPDLVLETPSGARVAVEVETGSNISRGKYLRVLEEYDYLVILPVTRKAYSQALREARRINGNGRVYVTTVAGLRATLRKIMAGVEEKAQKPE